MTVPPALLSASRLLTWDIEAEVSGEKAGHVAQTRAGVAIFQMFSVGLSMASLQAVASRANS